MTDPPTGRGDAAAAGGLLIGSVVALALVGLGCGAFLGGAAVGATAGAALGFGLGFWLVYSRYKEL